jgi:hypothetical protein
MQDDDEFFRKVGQEQRFYMCEREDWEYGDCCAIMVSNPTPETRQQFYNRPCGECNRIWLRCVCREDEQPHDRICVDDPSHPCGRFHPELYEVLPAC